MSWFDDLKDRFENLYPNYRFKEMLPGPVSIPGSLLILHSDEQHASIAIYDDRYFDFIILEGVMNLK